MRIHQASLEVLEKTGLANASPSWIKRVTAHGGKLLVNGRLCFPRGMVEDAIASAGRNFVMHGRDPQYDIEISGARTYFGIGTPQVQTLDIDSGLYRETSLLDVYDTTRLADSLEHVHFIKRPGVARDVEGAALLDINTAYAMMCATTKPAATGFFTPANLAQGLEMFDLSLGGDGSGKAFRKRPFMQIICTHVVPPLTFATENCDLIDAAVDNGLLVWLLSASQAGATAPASLAGAIVQGNAEVLAAITAINLESPGHSAIYGNWPLVCDLRTGAVTCSGGESGLLAAAVGQLARFYDLPSLVIAGAASSKLPDAQEGWEKGTTVATAALGGANLIYTGGGNLGDLLGGSLDTLLIDSEMMGAALRAVRGIEVTEDTLAVDVINSVANDAGHFLSHEQTLRLMKSEFLYPSLSDRRDITEWEQDGAMDMRERARQKARETLNRCYPNHVREADDARIRERFDIRLRRVDMRTGNGRW